jgi:hypothetical protein
MGSTSLLNVTSLAAANAAVLIMKRRATIRTNRIVILRTVFGLAGNKRKAKLKNHHILRASFVRTTELLAVDQFEFHGSRCFSQVRRGLGSGEGAWFLEWESRSRDPLHDPATSNSN